jgi:nucleotide-binding universal stress UspA family protein
MGTNGRTGFDRLFLGSVAEKVVRGAPCTVITVKPRPETP